MTNHFFIAFHPTKKFFHMVTNHLQERFRLRIDKIQFNSKCVADIHWIDAFPYQSSAGNFPQFQNPSETQVGNVETKEDYPNKTGSGRFWKTENGSQKKDFIKGERGGGVTVFLPFKGWQWWWEGCCQLFYSPEDCSATKLKLTWSSKHHQYQSRRGPKKVVNFFQEDKLKLLYRSNERIQPPGATRRSHWVVQVGRPRWVGKSCKLKPCRCLGQMHIGSGGYLGVS